MSGGAGNFIKPEYGTPANQAREHREQCGLEDPADRYDPPAGPPVRLVRPLTRYPMDGTPSC